MKRKFIIIVSFLAAVLIIVTNSSQGQDKASQKEFKKALDKALKKASEQMAKEMEKPEFWERIKARNAWMPVVEERPARWKIQISGNSIRDMRFISPNKLLVSYQFDNPVIIDTAKGRGLWKFKPDGWTRSDYSIVIGFNDLILIRGDGNKDTVLAAIDPKSGKQLWFVSFKNKKKSFQFVPVPAAEIILVMELMKKQVKLTAYQLFTGKTRWKKQYKIGKSGYPSLPYVKSGEIWCFYRGVRKIVAGTGETRWKRSDIVLDNQAPPPIIEEKSLYLIDKKKVLSVLDADNGETKSSITLDQTVRYTNIYPHGHRIYVRGEGIGKSETAKYKMIAVEKKGKRTIWSYAGKEPSVSNLIENNSRLYFSTPSTVICLDKDTGKQLFASSASQAGQTFPVRIMRFKDRIVYIGELIIAAFDPKTGKKIYSHGMTPVSQKDHLDALDNYISVLQTRIGKLTKAMWFSGSSGAATYFDRQAEISQNLSNRYSRQAQFYRGQSGYAYNLSASSDYWKSARLQNQAQIESAFSDAFAQLGFFFAMQEMTNSMLSASVAKDQADIRVMQYTRRTILAAYSAGLEGDYVFRPHREDEFLGIYLIHLPTGKAKFIKLSPVTRGKDASWNERGIWNLVDFKNAIIYHHGLRILPEKFQDKNPKDENIKAYGVHLIATPVTFPK